MISRQQKTIYFSAIPILAATGVILDTLTPLGVADWVWYFIPLLFSVYVGGRLFPYVLAAIFSILTLAGFFLSSPGIDNHLALVSRLMGIGVQWLMAFLISQRKGVEEELFESRQMLRLILDTIPQRIFWKDRNLRYLGCNRRFALDGGYNGPDELVGKSDFEASWKAVADLYRADDQQVLDTGKPKLNFDESQVRSDGAKLWLTTSKVPLLDQSGRVIGVLGTYEDITKRKQVEEQLVESRNYLDKIINSITDPIFVKDRQHRWVLLNDAFCDFMGHQREELLGKSDCDFFPKSEADVFWLKDEAVFTTGTENINEEEFTDRKGNTHTIMTKKALYTDEQGEKLIVGIIREITMRKQMEEALANERNLLRALMDNIPDGIYFKDRESRFTQINPALARHFGLSDPADAMGKTDFDFFSKEHAQQAYEDEQAIIRTGEPLVEKEEKETWSDGRIGWVSTTKMPLRNQEGQIIGTFGISRDITGRKRAEEEREQSVSLLQATLESTADGILVVDNCGKIVGFNERFIQLWHIPQTHIASRSDRQLLEFVTDQLKDPEGFLAKVHQLYTQPEAESFDVLEFKDERVFERYSLPQRVAGRPVGRVWSFRDATERRRAEEQIREQARLLDQADDAIIVRNLDDHVLYWNKGAERLFGWTAEEAAGQKVNQLLQKDAPNAFKYEDAKRAVLEKGDWRGEFITHTKSGLEVLVDARWTLVRDRQGNPRSIMGISTDITEKKKLESQFLRAQRMESLGTLAGGIAHDLNNVLTPLLVSVQVLKEKITDTDGHRLLEALETNVQRGASLVKQVLAFGRGVSGERISVLPKHIAREIRQIVRETFPKSVEFELRSDDELWTIIGDPTQLQQVLLNLCVNARDAMPDGGKLSIHMENILLDETFAGMNPEAKSGPYVLIEVTDSGTGIPRQIQDKIFDPFFTTKEPGKGTGLGLSTTLAIVKSHGGFINCYSEPGKGSTFKVYLPADTSPVGAEKAAAGQFQLPRGHNELVLVVDDEEPIRELAQRVLERFGYRVLLAADGNEAISLYQPRRDEIDVVVTDMVMPAMDGPATIVALKAINPEVKIVGSSGMASAGGMDKATHAGLRYFIPKPYTTEVMLRTLHEILHGDCAN